jgi:branched-chain amino acid transport system ATP-binding protein
MSLFSTAGLVKQFGSLRATDNVSFEVGANEVHALIGPNGAGKSTLVNLISGMLPADAGSIRLNGVELTGMAPHRRVRAGLSRCFQVTNLFKNATVRSNLMLAVQAHQGHSYLTFGRRDGETALVRRAEALAERVGLAGVLERVAGSLPYGAQRQLDVALALAAEPRLLLLDEPMAGMGPEESVRMVELIQTLRRDMAIVLIEHDMDAVFRLADRISVLVYGRVLATGSADEIRAHPEVQAVYLGSEADQ